MQDAQPSPLALLAATCSKIGAPSHDNDAQGAQVQIQTTAGLGAAQGGGTIRLIGPGGQLLQAVGDMSNPSLVNAGLTLGGGLTALGGGLMFNGAGNPTVLGSVGQLQTLMQPQAVGAGQMMQTPQLVATPVSGPGGTIQYNLMPQLQQFQSLTVQGPDGQEQTVLVPSANLAGTTVQPQQQNSILTPSGQLIKAQNVGLSNTNLTTSQTVNINVGGTTATIPLSALNGQQAQGGNTVLNLGALQNVAALRQNNFVQTVQVQQPQQPQVQTIPVQIPVSTNGGTMLQTVHLPVQTAALQQQQQQQNSPLQAVFQTQLPANVINLVQQQQQQQQQVAVVSTAMQTQSSIKTEASVVSSTSSSTSRRRSSGKSQKLNSNPAAVPSPQPQPNAAIENASSLLQTAAVMASGASNTSTVPSLAQPVVSPNTAGLLGSLQGNTAVVQNVMLPNGQIVQTLGQAPATAPANSGQAVQLVNQNGQVVQGNFVLSPNGTLQLGSTQPQQQQQGIQIQNVQSLQNMQTIQGLQTLATAAAQGGAQVIQTPGAGGGLLQNVAAAAGATLLANGQLQQGLVAAAPNQLVMQGDGEHS